MSLRSVTINLGVGSGYTRSELTIPMTSGLHVLYGLNGVGKSRILRAIEAGDFNVFEPFPDSAPEHDARHPDRPRWTRLWEELLPDTTFGLERRTESELAGDEERFWGADEFLASRSRQLEFIAERIAPIVEQFDDYCSARNLVGGAEYELLWEILQSVAGLIWVSHDRLEELLDGAREALRQGDLSLTLKSVRQLSRHTHHSYEVTIYATPLPETPNLWAMRNRVAEALHAEAERERARHREAQNRRGHGSGSPPRLKADWAIHRTVGYGWFFEDAGGIIPASDRDAFEYWWGAAPCSDRFKLCTFTPDVGIAWVSVVRETVEEVEQVTFERLIDSVKDSLAPAGTRPAPRHLDHEQLERQLFESLTESGEPLVDKLCEHFSARATAMYRNLLLNAYELRVQVRPRYDWAQTGRFSWTAQDTSGEWVSLDELSDTQQRWAYFAIKLAAQGPLEDERMRLSEGVITILLVDEPERGLHRLAEAHLFNGLKRMVDENDRLSIAVASHSPVFLRNDLAELHHVTRDENGTVAIRSLEVSGETEATLLGIPTSELLQQIRKVLIVEGQHEVWVLDELFRDEFRRCGVLVAPLHGGKYLKTAVDSRLLFDFTTAEVVVMLDNERTARVENLWVQAILAKVAGQTEPHIVGILSGLSDRDSGEARYLRQFCTEAIKSAHYERVGFQMLTKPDITQYFPPSAFVSPKRSPHVAEMTWLQINKMFDTWCDKNSRPDGGLKEWLRKHHGADFGEARFRRAVSRLDRPHEDFLDLFQRICG